MYILNIVSATKKKQQKKQKTKKPKDFIFENYYQRLIKKNSYYSVKQ